MSRAGLIDRLFEMTGVFLVAAFISFFITGALMITVGPKSYLSDFAFYVTCGYALCGSICGLTGSLIDFHQDIKKGSRKAK